MYEIGISPRVYRARGTQRVTVRITGENEAYPTPVRIKIQPMEKYSIPHTPALRIDEEDRYPYVAMTHLGGGEYFCDYDFFGEQKYTVCVDTGEGRPKKSYIYAVEDDFLGLYALKGDMHLHTNRSDGEGTPFWVGCQYRARGFDFIAITDHHKMYPSREAKNAFSALTDEFFVFLAEEVHNKDMGYFHIINIGGEPSVNNTIETDDEYVRGELQKILAETEFPEGVNPRACAYRIFVANEIRRRGGFAIMAHPYWECYGEYNTPECEVRYHLESGTFDALEVVAGCDNTGNGNNLQVALREELLCSGVRVPVVGSSDSHSCTHKSSLFGRQYTLALASGFDDITAAISAGRSVAVCDYGKAGFFCIGSFRTVKYARFLLEEFYPAYEPLCKEHSAALAALHVEGSDGAEHTALATALRAAEEKINEYRTAFYESPHTV